MNNINNIGSVPKNLTSPAYAGTADTAVVLWNEEKNAKEYEIYVNDNMIGVTEKTEYILTGLLPETEYTVSVRCVYENNISNASVIKIKTEKKGDKLNVEDFGAIEGTDCTEAIQKAIDVCPSGGIVYIPKGNFISGAVFLKSNMTLQVDGRLTGSGDISLYPIMKYRFEGIEQNCYASLINTPCEVSNLKIIGQGVIDANGVELFKKEMSEKTAKRGRAICIRGGRNIYFKDITVRQSPSWCVHLIYCRGVVINNVKIHTKFDENGKRYDGIYNGDGLDIDSSSDVCVFDSMIASQDDCIAIKSGRDDEGRKIGIPSENIRITNSSFSYGFGVAVGSEMSGDVRSVLVKNCTFTDTYCMASIKAARGRGGIIENIRFDRNAHIKHEDEHHDCEWFRGAIYIDKFYSHIDFDLEKAEKADESTPIIRNIVIENASIYTESGNAVYLAGLPEMPLKNIILRNISAKGKYGMKVYNVCNLIMENVSVETIS